MSSLDAALDVLDEPMADPSILPTFMLSQLAAEHVKVALGGDGGDELWAGYPTYRAHRMAAAYAAVPDVVHRRVLVPIVDRVPVRHGYQTLEWKLKRFVTRWSRDPRWRHQEWMSNVASADLAAALTDDAPEPPRLAALAVPPAADRDVVNAMLALDFQSYLPGSVLTKVDRASMACGLEVRPPLLDNALIDFAFGLGSSWKLRRGTSKWLLKRVAAERLPADIVHRRKKGFGIPLARWIGTLLDARLNEIIEASPLWDAGLLDRETFRRWQAEHLQMRRDRSRPLWALLVLHHWYGRLRALDGR